MADVDQTLLISGMLRKARAQPGVQPAAAVAWLTNLSNEATDALVAGDVFVTSSTYKGQGQGLSQQFNAQELLALTEQCLQRLAAEEEAGGADKLPPVGAVVIGDFS